jgi:acetylornithine deacetylase/succinyl-diaminopimelate desuccinylase-like protein
MAEMTAAVEPRALLEFTARMWDAEIVPQLVDYVRVPAKSPHFDRDWESNGHIEAVIRMAEQWCHARPVAGMTLEIVRLPNRTPLLFFEIPGVVDRTVLLYGHLDKQPEMVGWRDGLGAWTPVLENGMLYGRGAADDGYAVFASLAAILALQDQGAPHARCVGVIECCEESGSYDLPAYLEVLAPRIGDVDFVIGLDSGCGNYDQRPKQQGLSFYIVFICVRR